MYEMGVPQKDGLLHGTSENAKDDSWVLGGYSYHLGNLTYIYIQCTQCIYNNVYIYNTVYIYTYIYNTVYIYIIIHIKIISPIDIPRFTLSNVSGCGARTAPRGLAAALRGEELAVDHHGICWNIRILGIDIT